MWFQASNENVRILRKEFMNAVWPYVVTNSTKPPGIWDSLRDWSVEALVYINTWNVDDKSNANLRGICFMLNMIAFRMVFRPSDLVK
jgi:hypothetical protein